MLQVKIKLWSPHDNQKKVTDSTARFKVVVSGRRFGKTTLAVTYLFKRALLTPKGQFYYIAPFYTQGKNIAWKLFKELTERIPDELIAGVNESSLQVTLSNGATVSIKGADRPDTLRGVGLDGVVMDEYADMRANVWEEIILPTLADKQGWALFIGTPKGFNSFYDLYTEAANKAGWEAFHFTSYDNPLLKREEIEMLKSTMSEEKFQQEVMADFRRYEGVVYKEFDRNIHMFNPADKQINAKEVIVGIDWGFTNPTACLKILVDNDDVYWIVDEYYRSGKTTDEVAEYVKTWSPNMIYPDPAEPDRNVLLKSKGLYVRDVNKDIKAGIDAVRELFRHKRIMVSQDCKNVIRELERYHYPEDPAVTKYDVPTKEDDHAMDAMRYALFMHLPAVTDNLMDNWIEEPVLYKEIGI